MRHTLFCIAIKAGLFLSELQTIMSTTNNNSNNSDEVQVLYGHWVTSDGWHQRIRRQRAIQPLDGDNGGPRVLPIPDLERAVSDDDDSTVVFQRGVEVIPGDDGDGSSSASIDNNTDEVSSVSNGDTSDDDDGDVESDHHSVITVSDNSVTYVSENASHLCRGAEGLQDRLRDFDGVEEEEGVCARDPTPPPRPEVFPAADLQQLLAGNPYLQFPGLRALCLQRCAAQEAAGVPLSLASVLGSVTVHTPRILFLCINNPHHVMMAEIPVEAPARRFEYTPLPELNADPVVLLRTIVKLELWIERYPNCILVPHPEH